LRLLTRDHTLAQSLIDHGDVPKDVARSNAAAGQLTKYIGMDGDAAPDLQVVSLRQGDRMLLCSDGLSNALDSATLQGLLSATDDLDTTCVELIDRANAAGGRDNVTALIIAV
jgi:protein phosphatase